HAVAPDQARQHEADDRIEQAEEDHVGAVGAEILEALAQHVPQVGRCDAADPGHRPVVAFPGAFHRFARRAHRAAGLLQRIPSPFDRVANVLLYGQGASPSAKGPRAAWLEVEIRSQVTRSANHHGWYDTLLEGSRPPK